VDDSGDSTPRTVSLDTVSIGGSDYGRITGLAPGAIQYKYMDTYTLSAQTGTGGATVNVLATGKPVNLIGHSFNTAVNVGNAGSVQAIHGTLTISNPPSETTVNMNASADVAPGTVTLGTTTIGGANFGYVAGLAPASIYYKDGDTNSVTVQTGLGGDTVNVRATSAPVTLIGHGSNTVNVGYNGSVQAIKADLTISSPGYATTVNVDDSADGAVRTVYLDTATIDSSNYGRVVGLAPAIIQYSDSDTANVTVQTGTGGDTDYILSNLVPVNLVGHGSDAVYVGYQGNTQFIASPLTITDPPSYATINVVDFADDTFESSVILDTVSIASSDYGRITGLSPAAILYKHADTNTVTI
jgi:hypothetical protein